MDFQHSTSGIDGVSTANRVLVVDDEPHVLSALRRALRPHGFEVVTAAGGEAAQEILSSQPVDAIISDMRMPGMSGAELLQASRRLAPDAVRILLTGHADVHATMQAVNEGEIFRLLLKPWEDVMLVQALEDGLQRRELERERDALRALTERQNVELLGVNARLEAEVQARTADLRGALDDLEAASARLRADFSGTVRLLSSLISRRAGLTSACPPQVAGLVRPVAAALGMAPEQINDLTFASLLQDIGKVGLSDTLVARPLEALNDADRLRVMRHPAVGVGHLMSLPSLAPAAQVLRSLYENFDGSGVPGEKAGTDIPLAARLLRVVTDFVHFKAGAIDLTALDDAQAFRRLRRLRGHCYDPACVDAFLASMKQPVIGPAQQVLVASANLRPGMRLAQDLLSSSGTLLLALGHELNEALIHQIRRIEELTGDFLWITVTRDDGHEIRI